MILSTSLSMFIALAARRPFSRSVNRGGGQCGCDLLERHHSVGKNPGLIMRVVYDFLSKSFPVLHRTWKDWVLALEY